MKPFILVGASLICGAIAAFLSLELSQPTKPEDRPKVIIANQTIDAGTPLNLSQIHAEYWPSRKTPPGVYSDTTSLANRITRQKIEAGELILESKLAPSNSKAGIAATIAPGKRAISVRVNELYGIPGHSLLGNYVDVLLNAKDPDGKTFSRIVLNRVKVLAIPDEKSSGSSHRGFINAVTLELSPDEAEQLELARNIGTLTLVLRNELDTDLINSQGKRLTDITPSRPDITPSVSAPEAHMAPKLQAKQQKNARPIVEEVFEIRGTKEGAKPS